MSDPSSLQIVASKALGGAERWFIRFAEALAERGAPAELAIRRDSALDGHPLGALACHRLPFLTTWDPYSRHAVSRLIAQRRPEIVQTYMGRATRLTRLSPRGGPIHLARLGGYYKLSPYRHAHGWIGNTRGLCDWMVRQELPADRVHHIYNFADPAVPVAADTVAALRARHAIPDDAWVLVTLGRFVPVKGQAHLLAALAALPEHIAGRPLRLVMVGDGPLAEPLHAQARQLGQAQRIVWAGWQRDPRPYLQLADLVVFPSLEAETLGNVILEAWSWERPLVTAEFRGARELTRHGEDAWCVPCADAAALATGIRETLGDATLRAALVARGRERVEREFGRAVIMDQYLALYRRLAGG
ncbi:glycosyl transferase [Marichromatium purpuratum 984]|uniref:Glycosyl transferase n=1 Tax=Marichromatium purpuratum 984 TaxID=765910 RepID=W0E7B6_MARPU|nr:glycosyltransferase [Marichromatium purpuratum]AHF05114.1 glycosyl transferase [Marichromatium purpuratum 984]